MTGFSRASFEAQGEGFSWELKSVNARGLELRFRLASGLEHIEPDIRSIARAELARGSCFFALQRNDTADRPRLSLNEDALALVVAAARRLTEMGGIGAPTADGLLAIPGVLQESRSSLGEDAAKRRDKAVIEAFGGAIALLKQSRQEEGGRLRAVLDGQLAAIEKLVQAAAEIAQTAPDVLQERIRGQVAALLSSTSQLDPDRLHQEAVLAATRADVREELDRLGGHIAAARELLASGDAVGRRLDFLAQEFNREANTLCSKAFERQLTTLGMELKTVIEQFREQVQNLE